VTDTEPLQVRVAEDGLSLKFEQTTPTEPVTSTPES
jgi:hypothetical protein